MDNIYFAPIGKRISEIRRSHHHTQEMMAEYLDITPKHVSYVERGKSSLSLSNLIEFCNLYNVSLDFVVLGKTENPALNQLPDKIIEILNTGSPKEIKQLNRYLEMYIELTKDK